MRARTAVEFPKGWLTAIIHQLGFALDTATGTFHVVNLASMDKKSQNGARARWNKQKGRK